jgi:biopolymer transport protein ExbB/TolQ
MATLTHDQMNTVLAIGDNVASPFHGIVGTITEIKDSFMGYQTVSIKYMAHVLGTAYDKIEKERSFLSMGFYKMGD